jgi:DNA repair exonuclease SbcCD ATPase subunit
MKLLNLEIHNFKPFINVTVPDDGSDLPSGLIIVRGPNSTGKSSLLEAMMWSLWGPDSVELNNDDLINFTSTFCRVVLAFEVAGTRYKIDRSYSSAEKTNVVLFKWNGNAWKRIADKTQSVASKVDEILGLEWKQAQNTLLVRQGEVAAISTATPVNLRKLLVDIYNIELLDKMSTNLDHFESDLEMKIKNLRNEYRSPEDIRDDIERTRKRITEFEKSIKSRSKEISSTEKILKSIPNEAQLKKASGISTEIERKRHEFDLNQRELEESLSQAGILDAKDEIIQARLDSLKKEAERVESERELLNGRVTTISEELGRISGTRSDFEEKIDLLTKPSGMKDEIICPTCSKPLSLRERDRLVLEYKQAIHEGNQKVTTLDKQRKGLLSDAKKFEQRLSNISSSMNAVEKVKSSHEQILKKQHDIEKLEQSLSDLLRTAGIADMNSLLKRFNKADLTELQLYVASLTADLKAAKKSASEVEENIKREQEYTAELEEKAITMKQLEAEIKEMETLNQHAKYVRRNLVNGFIADYVFQKRLLGIIKKATNQYVHFFTNAQYTNIDLEPTPSKMRSGAGLLLRIWDERDQAWKKTSQLSFGDRTAISLALRLGISRTMSNIRPLKDSPIITPRVRTVMLDEPLGGLDKTRRESVVSNLINDSNFEQILLITHTDVQGWEGVPIIEVAKAGVGSTATLEL